MLKRKTLCFEEWMSEWYIQPIISPRSHFSILAPGLPKRTLSSALLKYKSIAVPILLPSILDKSHCVSLSLRFPTCRLSKLIKINKWNIMCKSAVNKTVKCANVICKHSLILAALSKKEIMFIDLARACGLWLPFRGRKWGLLKDWQGKVQRMKPGVKFTTTLWFPVEEGSERKLMPLVQSLPSWLVLGGCPNSMLKGPEKVSCRSLLGWACEKSLVSYQSLHHMNGGMVLCPSK